MNCIVKAIWINKFREGLKICLSIHSDGEKYEYRIDPRLLPELTEVTKGVKLGEVFMPARCEIEDGEIVDIGHFTQNKWLSDLAEDFRNKMEIVRENEELQDALETALVDSRSLASTVNRLYELIGD